MPDINDNTEDEEMQPDIDKDEENQPDTDRDNTEDEEKQPDIDKDEILHLQKSAETRRMVTV